MYKRFTCLLWCDGTLQNKKISKKNGPGNRSYTKNSSSDTIRSCHNGDSVLASPIAWKIKLFLQISTIGQICQDRKTEPDFSIFRFEPQVLRSLSI